MADYTLQELEQAVKELEDFKGRVEGLIKQLELCSNIEIEHEWGEWVEYLPSWKRRVCDKCGEEQSVYTGDPSELDDLPF